MESSSMQTLWIIYGALSILAFTMWMFQMVTALICESKRKSKTPVDIDPSISVIMPFFNEEPKEILNSIRSIQSSKGIKRYEIILINDGSSMIYDFTDLPKEVKYIAYAKNKGKRHALELGIKQAKFEHIVLLDSDTTVSENSIKNIYQDLVNWRCDAMGGNLDLLNKNENFLTKLIDAMYWFAFNYERNSQSLFKCLTCCSGGFSIYKTECLKEISDKIDNQFLGGLKCTAGDDRHITSLLLMNGKKIGWSKSGEAQTISPSTYGKFIKQQIRWTRSMTLEIIWNLKRINHFPKIFFLFTFNTLFKYGYLVLTYFALFHLLTILSATSGFWIALSLIIGSFLILLLKCVIAAIWSKQIGMGIKTLLFGVLGYLLLSPFLIYGVLTCKKAGWLTRE